MKLELLFWKNMFHSKTDVTDTYVYLWEIAHKSLQMTLSCHGKAYNDDNTTHTCPLDFLQHTQSVKKLYH